MDITKYRSHFHDGILFNIVQTNDHVQLSLSSAEIDMKYVAEKDRAQLSDDRIKGILHLRGVKSILVKGTPIKTPLEMPYDSGCILDFEIGDKITNPEKYYTHWKSLHPKERAHLIEQHWPKEISNFSTQKEMSEFILRIRGVK